MSNFTDLDIYLFHEGKHFNCYDFMGGIVRSENGRRGVRFTTWAPNASSVYLVGDFSLWEVNEKFSFERVSDMGIWSVFIPGIKPASKYKFAIKDNQGNIVLKADPYGRASELRPSTASVVVNKNMYRWRDFKWMENRESVDIKESPMNIYELHLGSWKTNEDGEFLTYREIKHILPKYIKEMGYTHVELLPVMEHPLDNSWGYQVTGFYAATSRFGNANGLKELIDELHRNDIGVILDWVPGHFCKDSHGLYRFDGTPTYEYAEGWKSENKGWGTCNFDLGRPEVRSFLISNALFWLREYHIDGLRVDAVANMIYLNYGRPESEWRYNADGSMHNVDGVEFIKYLNSAIFDEFPTAIMAAEESTSWQKVSHKVEDGGLGFNYKWDMGWMNDTLDYCEADPIYRKHKHNDMTFSMMYNYSESFILPISHDEVVHGKKSLLNKMPGDYWNKFAGLRLFAAYMMGHPGKKLNFMGAEIGQFIEWREYEELEWKLLSYPIHSGINSFYKDLNKFYKENPALWQRDHLDNGFNWIDADNRDQSIFIFMRKGHNVFEDTLIFVCNFTPNYYESFRVGVPFYGTYVQAFNTDEMKYGGSGKIIDSEIKADDIPYHSEPYSVDISIPPMGTLVIKINEVKEIVRKKDKLEEMSIYEEVIKSTFDYLID
ncbi:1,4-alpha-glucan branching protein GlgB [uncultured Clostridium sp.]|uniref:1,4-alpha-glucan branching protein GlgB n=1 Tax=uncultured Clostridium sp. TaxID=59620 RepID=UPI00262E707F|nr:1,4-alpha-glucan branching protein GlgB [uncultured Clostridium sp.]